jgi:hypothetical protein
MRKPTNVYSTDDHDDAVAVSLGILGSDHIDDTDVHIAGPEPEGGGGAGEVYHPEVEFWVAVKNVENSPVFGPNCELADQVGGDAPQEGEPVVSEWKEGPLKKIQLQIGTIRAVRGK